MFKRIISNLLPRKRNIRTALRAHIDSLDYQDLDECKIFDASLNEVYERRLTELVSEALVDQAYGKGYSYQLAKFEELSLEDRTTTNANRLAHYRRLHPLLDLRISGSLIAPGREDLDADTIKIIASSMARQFIVENK